MTENNDNGIGRLITPSPSIRRRWHRKKQCGGSLSTLQQQEAQSTTKQWQNDFHQKQSDTPQNASNNDRRGKCTSFYRYI